MGGMTVSDKEEIDASEAAILAAIAAIPTGGAESVVNLGGVPSSPIYLAGNVAKNAVRILSGVIAAGVYSTILDIAGGGTLDIVAVEANDPTARNNSLRITLDGVVVYDKTVATAASQYGWIPVGGVINLGATNLFSAVPDPVRFNASCLVEYTSDITETDKAGIYLKYKETA